MDRKEINLLYMVGLAILIVLALSSVYAADPVPPDSREILSNVTKNSTNPLFVNISGARIALLDVNATIQNPRWKAFIGNVSGKFTLMDPEGAVVFDWTLASLTGRLYATANQSALSWSTVNCSNVTSLEWENDKINHTRPDDNITVTFNATFNSTTNITSSGSHDEFYVGGIYMPANTCPTLNTYNDSAAQDLVFEEMALYDGSNMIYATILEEDETGYNSQTYDFQMIVPEIGLPGYSSSTAYYLYVEIGT